MERQFFINWPAIVEEARQRRKSQKLTQSRLAKMAGVSTPTISRFENGEKDIQLSTIINILTVLGMNDKRHLIFPDPNEYYDPSKMMVIFTGTDRDKKIQCAINWEALRDHFDIEIKNPLQVFQKDRQRIEHETRRKYLAGEFESKDFILLKTEDIYP